MRVPVDSEAAELAEDMCPLPKPVLGATEEARDASARRDKMRTRRSPRNQERLFRALFEPEKEPVARTYCFDCASYPAGGRSRGRCTLIGTMVNGLGQRHCFWPRVAQPRQEGEQ